MGGMIGGSCENGIPCKSMTSSCDQNNNGDPVTISMFSTKTDKVRISKASGFTGSIGEGGAMAEVEGGKVRKMGIEVGEDGVAEGGFKVARHLIDHE